MNAQEFYGISMNQPVSKFEQSLLYSGYKFIRESDDMKTYSKNLILNIVKGNKDDEKVYMIMEVAPYKPTVERSKMLSDFNRLKTKFLGDIKGKVDEFELEGYPVLGIENDVFKFLMYFDTEYWEGRTCLTMSYLNKTY